MKQLKKYIRKELKSLKEGQMVKRPLPDDVKKTLFGFLKLKKSQINNIQAIKSIKPSYRIYLNNDQSFTITDLGNDYGFGLVTISNKDYDILDNRQYYLALIALNDLQTKPLYSNHDEINYLDTPIKAGIKQADIAHEIFDLDRYKSIEEKKSPKRNHSKNLVKFFFNSNRELFINLMKEKF